MPVFHVSLSRQMAPRPAVARQTSKRTGLGLRGEQRPLWRSERNRAVSGSFVKPRQTCEVMQLSGWTPAPAPEGPTSYHTCQSCFIVPLSWFLMGFFQQSTKNPTKNDGLTVTIKKKRKGHHRRHQCIKDSEGAMTCLTKLNETSALKGNDEKVGISACSSTAE